MRGRRIRWLLLAAAGCWHIMLYDYQGLRFLLCCMVCIPVAGAILLIPGALRCRVGLEAAQSTVLRGEVAALSVTLTVKGALPVAGAMVKIRCQIPGEKEIKVRRRLDGLRRGRMEEIPVEIAPFHCGRVRVSVEKAVIYDFFGIFSLPVRGRQSVEICIAPVISPVFGEAMEEPVRRYLSSMGEREGDLLTRDLLPGDSLHRIYWKLAAKDRELQVRDAEQGGRITLFLNFREEFCRNAEEWDRYLDRACSLLCFFAEGDGQFPQVMPAAVWRQGGAAYGYDIRDRETLQTWLRAVLLQEAAGELLAEEVMDSLAYGFRLEEDCRLYFGEQCVYE